MSNSTNSSLSKSEKDTLEAFIAHVAQILGVRHDYIAHILSNRLALNTVEDISAGHLEPAMKFLTGFCPDKDSAVTIH